MGYPFRGVRSVAICLLEINFLPGKVVRLMSGQLVDLKDDGPLQLNIFLVGVYKPGASAYLVLRFKSTM